MSNDADIWMPVYWGDYVKKTMHLTQSQHGAYFLLMGHYWNSGEPLPDDDDQLKAITKSSGHIWKKFRPILEKFFIIKDGLWHHKRIDEELKKAAENKDKRSKKAKKAADARWENNDATSMPGACPSPSPTTSPKEEFIDSNNDNDRSLGRDRTGRILLRSKTIEDVKEKYPNWSTHAIEDAFNELNERKVVKYPDTAFKAFADEHVSRNGNN